MEGVLASFAQFDNDVRSDRTKAGMKAALELGHWAFLAPIGYINVPRTYGKSLIPDPEPGFERGAVLDAVNERPAWSDDSIESPSLQSKWRFANATRHGRCLAVCVQCP
jgi:hypothetical protein